MLASQSLLRGSWTIATMMSRRRNKDGKVWPMIWLSGRRNCPMLFSRCWRHLPMLVSLLEIYCLPTTSMVCGRGKSRFRAPNSSLTSVIAASHQYYCLAKQLLINHAPSDEERLTESLDQIKEQAETIDLLRRACAVAESHTGTMGIVLMSTLPVLACKYDSRFLIRSRHLESR